MTTKHSKSSGPKKGARPAPKAAKPAAKAAKPAAKAAARPAVTKPAPPKAAPKAKAAAPIRLAVPARPAPARPSLLEQAERLRDDIQRTKLSHPDPWAYGTKARRWSERAQAAVMLVATGSDIAAGQRAVDTLQKEVESDKDFREARRLL